MKAIFHTTSFHWFHTASAVTLVAGSASAAERKIRALEQNLSIISADKLAVTRSSLTKALILPRCVNYPQFEQKHMELIRKLPHKYHSQGTDPAR
jgi:hypothetical protein